MTDTPSQAELPLVPQPGEVWQSENGHYRYEQGKNVISGIKEDNEMRFLTIDEVVQGDPAGREVRGTLKSGEPFTATIPVFLRMWTKT